MAARALSAPAPKASSRFTTLAAQPSRRPQPSSSLKQGIFGIGTTTPGSLFSNRRDRQLHRGHLHLLLFRRHQPLRRLLRHQWQLPRPGEPYRRPLNLASQVAGILGVNYGGTGTTSATGAISNLLYLSSAASTTQSRSVQGKLDDVVSVKDFGAKGDGISDDTAAIQSACTALYYAGGGTLYFPSGRYALNSGQIDCYGSINLRGAGRQSVIVGRTSANNSSRQITVSSCLSTAYTPTCPGAASVIDRTATGAIAAGQFSLTLSNVSGLNVGDTVYMWLGDDPTDYINHSLPYVNLFNTISAINGNVITFSDPVPEAVADPSGVGRTHHVWKPAAMTGDLRYL